MAALTTWQANELTRCAINPAYFIENWLYLKDPIKGKIPFRLYDWQRDILGLLMQRKNVVAVKSRQVGASWIGSAYALWLAAFHPYIQVLLLSRNESSAIKLLDKVKFMVNTSQNSETSDTGTFLFGMETSSTGWTKTQVSFWMDTGDRAPAESVIDSLTTTGQSGRGESAYFILGDEFAFLPDKETTWTAIKPTTSRGGHYMLISTPNGAGDLFHRMVEHGLPEDEIDYVVRKIHWSDCPGLDDAWYKRTTSGMTSSMRAQEYELEFNVTGSPAFNPTDLTACYQPVANNPAIADIINRSTHYFVGIDTASGGGDHNALVALNEFGVECVTISNNDTVGRWAGRTETLNNGERVETFGLAVTTLLDLDKKSTAESLVMIERNAQGESLLNRLVPTDFAHFTIESMMTTGTRFGTGSKPTMINTLALAIESHAVTITSPQTLFEMRMYQSLGNGKFEAVKDCNDDLVMAFALALYAANRFGIKEIKWDTKLGPRQLVQTAFNNDATLHEVLGSGPKINIVEPNRYETNQKMQAPWMRSIP